MKLVQMGDNLQFVEDDFGNKYCFRYSEEIANIKNGVYAAIRNQFDDEYTEYDREKFQEYYGY